MNANELADELTKMFRGEEYDRIIHEIPDLLRQQQAEIDRLNYDLDGFKQNFFVSGFHLQIKMANEQLVKKQAEIERLIGAEPITYGMLTFCKNCGQQNPYFEKAQEK
jgi:hypothetical protein